MPEILQIEALFRFQSELIQKSLVSPAVEMKNGQIIQVFVIKAGFRKSLPYYNKEIRDCYFLQFLLEEFRIIDSEMQFVQFLRFERPVP